MTRDETKKLLPIMQAFAEGKTIEYMGINGQWVETDQPVWGGSKLRIKPEPKYRAFENQEECWNEMMKHQPFGWIRNKDNQEAYNVSHIWENHIKLTTGYYDYNHMIKRYEFMDGSPFGINNKS